MPRPKPIIARMRQLREQGIEKKLTKTEKVKASAASTTKNPPSFHGRRVVSCKSLQDSVKLISLHGRICRKSSLSFDQETKSGFATELWFKCVCGWEVSISSDSGEEQFPINKAFAMGCINTPLGFDDSNTLITCLGIPSNTKHTFLKEQKEMTKVLKEVLEKNLKENAEEEVRLAIENNQFVNVGGIAMPWVQGIADGGWVKRSLGHSYNSNYGHAAIIGARTRKILHYGWRQKVCKICTLHDNKQETAPEHECYKNWEGPSTAMEADIVKVGFAESITKHHFVYASYIGDGDSSVYLAVKDIYPGIEVKKIECVNHVIRNVNTKVTKLSGPPTSSRGVQVTQDERRLEIAKKEFPHVGKVLRNLCLYFNQKDKSPENISALRTQILNIADHTFGNHVHCLEDLCEDAGSEDPQFATYYSQTGLYKGLRDILKRPSSLANTLILCGTSNIVESFINVVAKYVEGKRKNLGGMNLYQTRVIAATLSFNTSSFFSAEVPSMNSSGESNERWVKAKKRAVKRRAQPRKYYKSKRVKLSFRFLGNKTSRGDLDYGDDPSKPDIEDTDLQALVNEERRSLQVNESQLKWIEKKTRDQAESTLWFEHRKNRITASNAGKIFKLSDHVSNTATLKTVLGYRKITGKGLWNVNYGKLHEDEAAEAFAAKYPEAGEVRSCGLIIDLENGIFGASPDRRVGETEIKTAPSIRDKDPKEWPDLPKNSSCPLKKSADGVLSLKRDHDHFYQCVVRHAVSRRQTEHTLLLFSVDPSGRLS